MSKCKDTLVSRIAKYEGSVMDRLLYNDSSFMTQEDEFLLSQKNLTDLVAAGTIQDVLQNVPFMLLGLTVARPVPGIDMNPWLLHVVGVPTLHKIDTARLLFGEPNYTELNDDEYDDLALEDVAYMMESNDPYTDCLPPSGHFCDFLLRNVGPEVPAWESRHGMFVGPDIVNHGLILPNSVLHTETCAIGVAHMAATFLTTRCPILRDESSIAATVGSLVTHLLERDLTPETRGFLFTALDTYRKTYPDNCTTGGGLHRYLEVLGTNDFRLCLVTDAKDAYRKFLKCEHLTKFVLGLFLLVTGPHADRAVVYRELPRYRLALFTELFHRMKVPLQFQMGAVGLTAAQWFEQQVRLPSPKELVAAYPSLKQARAALVPGFIKSSAGVTLADLGCTVKLHDDTVRQAFSGAHFQFHAEMVDRVMNSLGTLYSLSPAPVGFSIFNEPELLARVLHTAQIKDNGKRAAALSFDLPMGKEEMERLGGAQAISSFRRDALRLWSGRLEEAYIHGTTAVHAGAPRVFPSEHLDEFYTLYGVDLREELHLTSSGLSTTRCCFRACPHYLQPLGEPKLNKVKGGEKYVMSGGLVRHLQYVGGLPGIHKAVAKQVELNASVLNTEPIPGSTGDVEGYGERVKERLDSAVATDPSSVEERVAEVVEAGKGWTWESFVAAVVPICPAAEAAIEGDEWVLGRSVSILERRGDDEAIMTLKPWIMGGP